MIYMRKIICFVLFVLLGLSLAGCSRQNSYQHFVGYINIVGNTLYVDRVEITVLEDFEEWVFFRIEHELFDGARVISADDKIRDMPNGYYIRHLSEEILSFEITDETVFSFVDSKLLFDSGANVDRFYSTTNPDNFLLYHFPAVPYFIIVHEGKVLAIIESFWLTM